MRISAVRAASARLLSPFVIALLLVGLVGCAPSTSSPSSMPGASTAPEPEPEPAELDPDELRRVRAAEIVGSLSTRERVASVIMATAPGTDADMLHDYVANNGLGGFILMGGNVPADADSLAKLAGGLSSDPALPVLVGIDQEGGEVSRVPWDESPGADRLKRQSPKHARAAFEARAEMLAAAGVNVNFGIVADVPSGDASFIYGRALGTSPSRASDRVAAAVTGEREAADAGARIASTLKHFPGHGAAEGDSHSSLPSTELSLKAWRKSHARPFEAGIDSGAELLMFGHLVFTSIDDKPASLSKRWHRIAREDLGFDGMVVSDDLGMLLSSGLPEYSDVSSLIVASLVAGTDLTLVIQGVDPKSMPQIIDRVTAAVEAGSLPSARLQEAAERVTELRLRLAGFGEAALR